MIGWRLRAVHRDDAQSLAFAKIDVAEPSVAERDGMRQYHLEHRREFAARGRDGVHHLRGCSLLLPRPPYGTSMPEAGPVHHIKIGKSRSEYLSSTPPLKDGGPPRVIAGCLT